jgi:hypothetical protein
MEAWNEDYEIVVNQINGPAEPDSFYWHLFYKESKVNGGLADSRKQGQERARQYRQSHTRSIVLTSHVWDLETATWIPRAELNIV